MKIKHQQRYSWKNDVDNQEVDPLGYYTPKNLDDLVDIIINAEANNCTVRAVGSGHSFSDVVQTNGFLVNTDELDHPLELDRSLLKEGTVTTNLVQVEAGMKIQQLNDYLDKNNLALLNMGGYDGQSIAGACSTSTHGSGMEFGPLSSFYKSILLVAAGGAKYRIEPEGGITDRAKHEARFPDIKLIQDDKWFNTVSVSMGCTGIIYSVVLEVREKYWLQEKRFISDWETVKAMLKGRKCLTDWRHFEVLVNPYIVKGKRQCLITERKLAEKHNRFWRKRGRHYNAQFAGLMPLIMWALDYLVNRFPTILPRFINLAMCKLRVKKLVDISYNILNLGMANLVSAYSSELAFSMEDDKYLEGMEKVFEVAEKLKNIGRIYHASPISMRFVKASDSYLSMMNGRNTCMLEIPVINHTYGGVDLLQHYEELIMKLGGRLHWGQLNTISGCQYPIEKSYPNFEKWNEVYKQLNANGTFNNSFTDRFGLSINNR